ncbi:hypothetical protein SAMN04490248_115105 [Salinihabitans flavidus]|uniref:Collagen triple helix repeat-containing protein n=1 Tax=Salinihabitans flavidus TaxID=569882 RepID=A0A1H8THS5_9RHOB|nr:hypothetical protein [Salinihabitans flavidus]SEO90437.1 hypothetical protein SAMN04490248_115105 [Salinihabitans flavidus]
MSGRIDVAGPGVPIRLTVSDDVPLRVGLAAGPVAVRVPGLPGPEGKAGPPGARGEQGDPGVTVLPTDAPINGGFF